MKRSIFIIIFVGLIIGMVSLNTNTNTNNVSAATFNYAEALQKAIYFYECQASGTLPSWNRAKGLWRGDAQLGCAVQGGWVDAGDHVKFNLPLAYSASMLGWAMYEYGSAFTGSGQATAMQNNLKWALDYLVACDKGSSFVYQIGDGGVDHSFWGPIEVCEKKKGVYPAFSCTASCVTAQAAAALAIGYKVLGNSTYLTHAKSLFNLADSTRSDATYTAANGYYNSWSGFWDELLWAATWLYIATNDSTYLTKAQGYVANLGKEGQSSEIAYKWAPSWDDQHDCALFLLARITGNAEYDRAVRNNLDWLCGAGGPDGTKCTTTPGGLVYVDSWGSLRYACNAAFLAFVYSDWTTDSTLKSRYRTFAERQINYALGANPRNSSYVVGFGNNPPKHPHHRTAHGSWADSQSVPPNHRHTLYGALVGGPNANDAYTDSISDYVCNEVACDYNACFIGCLAKMYSLYGGTPLSNFPAPDPVDDEFFVEAGINAAGTNFTEIKALCNNRSGFPARFVKNLSFRYYMDLSEVFEAGYTTSNLKISTNYVEFPATITLVQYSGNIYYLNVAFNDGTSIYPGGQSEYAGEIQVRISAPDQTNFWNPANDFSYQGLPSGGSTIKTANIPVYDGNTKLYGNDPGSITPPPKTPTPVRVTPTPVRTETPVRTATPRRTATPGRTATPVQVTPTPVRVTPTPVRVTPTPVVTTQPPATPTPVPPSGNIKVQFFNQERAATSNQIYANFRLVNTGTSAIALSTVKMRYWYTKEGTQAQNFWCDWSPVGSGNITHSFVTMSTPKTGADTYVEVGFTSGAGNLAAGGNVPVQTRIAKSDWSNYNQSNDYSFNSSATTFVDWTKVTGYVSGSLQWGTEP